MVFNRYLLHPPTPFLLILCLFMLIKVYLFNFVYDCSLKLDLKDMDLQEKKTDK